MKPILAQRLRAARQAMHPKVTQRDVAKRMKLSPSLASWPNVSTDWLLVADDTRYPSYRMDDGVTVIGRVTEVTVRRALM